MHMLIDSLLEMQMKKLHYKVEETKNV